MNSATTTNQASDTVAAWDHAAQGWDRHAPIIHAWLEQATAALLAAARIAQGDRVLDIAAGAGDQTLSVAHRVGPHGQVLATDISPGILLLAARNAQAAGLQHVTMRVADAESLGLAGEAFDAAICRLGLMFCPAPLRALREAHAALRPGGRFSALVFAQAKRNPCLAILMTTALRHAGRPPRAPDLPGSLTSLGQPGLLAELLQAAGFIDVEVTTISAPFSLPSSRAYVDFVRTSGTPIMEILASLSPVAQQAAWDDMAEQLQTFDGPIGWVGPNELLLCAASAPV